MVSYYNPATAAAMFSRSGSGYPHHHHHSPPTQNHPYFTPGYGAGYHHHNPHSHHASHQAAAAGGSGGTGSPVGSGLGATGLPGGVASTQFSPNMTTDFNCNHQYNAHFGNMTPDSMAAAAAAAAAAVPWPATSSMYSTACAAAAARNAAAVAAGFPPPPPPSATHASNYEDWSSMVGVSGGHPHHPHSTHPHAYPQHHPHPSFYNHHASVQQPSPPSSTPSSPSSSHSPSHHVYSTSSTTPNNNANSTNNNITTFKTEFGPCSGGNNQDASSQEMQQTNPGNTASAVVTSAGPSIGTPHSPDSGMAISDGVSSSGSPATNGQQFHQTQHCLGGPSSNSSGSSSTNHSSSANPGGNNGVTGNNGSDNSQQQQFATSGGNMVHGSMSSHHNHHGHLHNMNSSNNNQNSGNLSHHHHSHHQSLVNNHPNGIVNVTSTGRPTQARSPYEWMKKPTYSCSSSGSNPSSNSELAAKTRTKDKYRVVYSDTQRLELEKEFHYSRYITIRRKAELASTLGLSERQVKIWFQNRRAKERKVQRKREEMLQREKISAMVHMQNAAVAAAGGMGGPMCNQPNGGVPLSALM